MHGSGQVVAGWIRSAAGVPRDSHSSSADHLPRSAGAASPTKGVPLGRRACGGGGVVGSAAVGLLWVAASACPAVGSADLARPEASQKTAVVAGTTTDDPPPPSALLTGWDADGSLTRHSYGDVGAEGADSPSGPLYAGATSPRSTRSVPIVGGPPPAAIPFPTAVQLFVPGAVVAMYAIRRMRRR